MMAIYAYVYMMANFGFETHGVRSLSLEFSNTTINSIIVLRSIYLFFILTIIAALSILLNPLRRELLMIQAASLVFLPLNVQYIFRSRYLSKYDGFYRLIQAFIFFLLVYSFVNAQNIILVPLLWFIIVGAVSVPFYLIGKKKFLFSFSVPDSHAISKTFFESFPIGLAGLIILLYLSFDTVLLGIMADSRAVGIYTAAFKYYIVGYSLLEFLFIAFLPMLIGKQGKERLAVFKKYQSVLAGIAALIAVIGIFLSQFLITEIYGNTFFDSIGPLRILLVSLSVSCFTFTYVYVFQAMGKNTIFIILLLLRLGVFLLLCFVLIPSGGVMGAAYATLLSEVITVIVSYVCFKKSYSELFGT